MKLKFHIYEENNDRIAAFASTADTARFIHALAVNDPSYYKQLTVKAHNQKVVWRSDKDNAFEQPDLVAYLIRSRLRDWQEDRYRRADAEGATS